MKLELADVDVSGKRVLVRVDFNVPMADGKIADDNRLTAALPTLFELFRQNAKIILVTHLGRPAGRNPALSTAPIAVALSQRLGRRVQHVSDCVGAAAQNAVATLKAGELLLLENVRFYPGEMSNDADFAQQLASLADVYVNDAFGTAHRAHASTEGVTHYLNPSVAGVLMAREIYYLRTYLESPERPYVAILGGAKIGDKISLIENLLQKVDELLIGGGMIYTFLAAMGHRIGDSLVNRSKIKLAQALLENRNIHLPVDIVVGKDFKPNTDSMVVEAGNIPDGWQGLDIGPNAVAAFRARIARAKTVIWNGPLGVYEFDKFAKGTIEIARALATASDAVHIIGGGDCVAAVRNAGVADRISHISTGGGATLAFLEGKQLPGIAALTDK